MYREEIIVSSRVENGIRMFFPMIVSAVWPILDISVIYNLWFSSTNCITWPHIFTAHWKLLELHEKCLVSTTALSGIPELWTVTEIVYLSP